MTVLQRFQGSDQTQTIKLDKGQKPSFGICIVRGEVKESPSSIVSGVFIKDIIPHSPAQECGKLKVGDRILSLNDHDVRNATEAMVIDLIRSAGQSIIIEIQTFEQTDSKSNTILKSTTTTSSTNQPETGKFRSTIKKASIKRAPAPPKPNTDPGSNSSAFKNEGSSKPSTQSPDASDDEEDTRDMTGRTHSAAGYEIDRASAANAKLSAAEQEADTEQEDEFGYTTKKIKKRYSNLGPVHKTEVIRPPNTDLGLALAGHRDRQQMACMVAGINPTGIVKCANLKPADQLLEVNGYVLTERCHLNASVIFKKLVGEKIVFIVLRRPPNKYEMAVQPVQNFPPIIDETEYLFTTYKNVRAVQIQKGGASLGIMIIEGKHSEVGPGIFISDLQAESSAELAGLKVGEMILAINKDVIVDTSYDMAAGILKRAEGVVTLVVCSLKSEEQEAEEKAKEEAKKNAPPPEPEKPQDPATAEIRTNQKTLIEIKPEKKHLGCVVVGGKNGYVTTGAVITNIFADGVLAKDNRLQPFDQILEINSTPLNATEMTILKIHQFFHLPYDRITLMVWRNDPLETEKINIEIMKKPGKDLGLAMVANPKGVCITEIVSAGCADIDSRLQRGDIINKLNGDTLENATFEECYALFRAATGKISMEILRPKPTVRT